MAKKRITRKQLLKEPDEFITFTGRAIQFAVQYKTQLLSVSAAAFFLILLITGYRYFSIRTENRANDLLQKSIAAYQSEIAVKSAYDAYLAAEGDFQRIIQKYASTASGKIARLVFANICYQGGNAERALSLYQQALDDFDNEPSIRALIITSLGYCSEEMQDYPAAADHFKKIAESSGAFLKAEAMFQLGRIYEKMGEIEKSNNIFKTIISDFPTSMYVELLREKV